MKRGSAIEWPTKMRRIRRNCARITQGVLIVYNCDHVYQNENATMALPTGKAIVSAGPSDSLLRVLARVPDLQSLLSHDASFAVGANLYYSSFHSIGSGVGKK
jgi:hypothetical protein